MFTINFWCKESLVYYTRTNTQSRGVECHHEKHRFILKKMYYKCKYTLNKNRKSTHTIFNTNIFLMFNFGGNIL